MLERYVVAAAMKLSRHGRVALVDGYAGANAYGTEIVGSTHIMCAAAKRVGERAWVRVYACEPDPKRFAALEANLRKEVSTGLLRALRSTHAEANAYILAEIGDAAAIVFLDPHTVTQLTLEDDIWPWSLRPKTDVLGVFMASHAARCCAGFLAGSTQAVHPQKYLGVSWQAGKSEDGAYRAFFEGLGDHKRFKGLYRLRKQAQRRDAYGIFGLSDHSDGYWLLSNAVAKDFGALRDFDLSKLKTTNLFAELEREDEEAVAFESLTTLAAPIIRANPSLRGARLASTLFDQGIGITELFGRFTERDFTTAAYHILGIPDRRSRA